MSSLNADNETTLSRRSGFKRNGIIYLLIAIPVASLLMGAVSLYVAFEQGDAAINTGAAPLSKTSWQQEGAQ